jgi:peroxiredoxin
VKRLIIPAVGLVIVLAAGFWYARLREPDRPQVDRVAPSFQLRTLSGADVSLASVRGKPVILNFWATWCEPCKQEMPALQAAADAHPELQVLAIDDPEPVDKARSFVAGANLRFPILLDPDAAVLERYRITGKPSSFFVDREGVLRAIYLGAMSEDVLNNNLQAIGVG